MKKIVLLLVLLSVCTFAFATEGRVNGMGVNPIFYNDDYLFTIFPQYITHYMNNAYIDAYYNSYYDKTMDYQYSGGLNFKLLGNDFGIYINRDFPIKFDYNYARLDKAMNLYLALGELGLGFDVAMDNYYKENEYSKSKETLKENTLGLGGKLGVEISGFDIAGQVYFATGKSKTEVKNENDTYVEEIKNNDLFIYGATRMKMFETEKSCVYPAVEMEFCSAKKDEPIFDYYYDSKIGEKEKTFNYMSINPGIGMNHWLTDKVLVIAVASCGFYSAKEKTTNEYDTTSTYSDTTYSYNYNKIILPKLELGLEAYLAKWLTVRAGINKTYFYKSTTEPDDYCKDDYKKSFYDSDFTYSFGVGLEFGKFTIDWEICDDLYWEGPFIVTGNESEFAGSFTVKYNFGK